MSKPVNIAATATSQSQPPLATQVQAQTANDSLQNYLTKQSEFQQPPLHSQDDSISNLRQISGALLAVHRCLTELQQHVDSIRTSIDSMLPPHTTNTAPLTTSSPQAAASPAPAADTTSTPVPVPESSWESDPSEEEEEEEEVRSSPRSELISTHRSELESLCDKKVKVEDKEEEDVRCPPRSELISTHRSELESLCDKKVKVEDKEEEDARCPPRSELISTHHSELESLCNKEVIEEDKEEEDVRFPPRSELISTHRSELESLCEKEVKEDKEEEDVRFPPRSELISTPRSELESLCEMMDGRGLRRYMVMHLLDIKGLLEQVPKALRLSSNPARLVLECVGKFYTQKGKAFVKGSQMVQSRKASVLVLQCFLLMGISDEIEIGVKQEAEQAALAWRKRLIAEAGILKAEEIDARGLLMLVGCFGIPGRFKNEDIRDLIWVIFHGQGRIRKILFSGSLRRSNVLVAKIPDIIEGMAMQKMEVDAAHIAYTFGIEDRVSPQRFLTSFLLESEESLKKMVEQSQGSLAAVDQAKRKHLFDLRSVIKCLGHHDIDPSELLPRWQINEKIMSLEKEITVGENLNKKEIARGAKMAQKRKIDETESSRWFSNKEPKHSHVSNPWLQQERVDSTPGQIGSHTGQLYGRLGNAAMYDGLASCSYTHPLSYLYWPR
nr:PREDICTED: FRIGIDA-like protein 3 [Nicotiana tabacum]